MYPKLPQLFGLLPKAKVEVGPVEDFREKEAAGADYNQGTPDGSRPGLVYVNTGDSPTAPSCRSSPPPTTRASPATTCKSRSRRSCPLCRRSASRAGTPPTSRAGRSTPSDWARTSASYQDPLNDYGRLSDELLRAIRLVVDTGVHYKHWTREQVVTYFRRSLERRRGRHPGGDRPLHRLARPGAGLQGRPAEDPRTAHPSPKRARAEVDIRAFHDEVLDGGALPLDVLDARTTGWIQDVKAGTAPAHPQ